jgi:drug/metabolite transporter (DMT)-like permease
MVLSLTGALGQIVVYWMINNFKQHVVPFIVTTRKIFTLVISICFYKHESTSYQIFGIFIIFAAVVYGFLDEISGRA